MLKNVENTSMTEVIDKVNEFSPEILKENKCPKCSDGNLSIKFAFTVHLLDVLNIKKTEVVVNTVMQLEMMKIIKNYLEKVKKLEYIH